MDAQTHTINAPRREQERARHHIHIVSHIPASAIRAKIVGVSLAIFNSLVEDTGSKKELEMWKIESLWS